MLIFSSRKECYGLFIVLLFHGNLTHNHHSLIHFHLWQQFQIKQTEANVQKAIERRSLVPRMIYLSIQCASSSLKENIEANGSILDPKGCVELKSLLERYAMMLGHSFQDATDMVLGVSSGQKSSEV